MEAQPTEQYLGCEQCETKVGTQGLAGLGQADMLKDAGVSHLMGFLIQAGQVSEVDADTTAADAQLQQH